MTQWKNTSTDPIYNIKSVAEMTGIPPVTLRAWERRYGFPVPGRTESGYRLYSEYDVAAINWLKLQTESGLSIAQAIKLLHGLSKQGDTPIVRLVESSEFSSSGQKSLEQLQREFAAALMDLDEARSRLLIRTAFQFYSLEDVLLEMISPTMVEVGDRWHSGEISVAVEHFATHHCRLHLMNALEATTDQAKKGSLVAACAPLEWHELGILMLVVMLRWRGWCVTYLGPNLSLERLEEALIQLKPQMLLFSATGHASAEALQGLRDVLNKLPEPRPIVGLGGQAFVNDPTLTNRLPGTFIGPSADDSIKMIERMLAHV